MSITAVLLSTGWDYEAEYRHNLCSCQALPRNPHPVPPPSIEHGHKGKRVTTARSKRRSQNITEVTTARSKRRSQNNEVKTSKSKAQGQNVP